MSPTSYQAAPPRVVEVAYYNATNSKSKPNQKNLLPRKNRYNSAMKLFKKKTTAAIGKTAEATAVRFLQKRGLKLLTQNYRCRFGEIDIIMSDKKDTVIFIEVRCRADGAAVNAAESITPQKIRKIQTTAQHYLMTLKEIPACRFDVIAMTHNPHSDDYNIEWLKDAF